jgi:hypothetical protein
VYLGTDEQAVADGTVSPVSIPAADGCVAGYDPLLELGRTYYWKVNEVNMVEEPNTWEGDIWSFSTPEYLVVDDMVSYGDVDEVGVPGSRIWYTWKDGQGWDTPSPAYGGNGTGSVIELDSVTLYDTPQSMAYHYSSNGTNFFGNTGKAYYSESTALISDLEIGNDWTVNGIKSLILHFYGAPGNAAGATEQMYVKLNGAKVPYDGDANDITEPSWHEWNIDLALFGINLQNVTEISIGFGNEGNVSPGGLGVVYFDDIRLYPSGCVLSRRSADFAIVDYVQDCVVDYKEVKVMAETWLREVSYYEDFDSYAAGSALHGQGGWKGWDNDPAWGAPASSVQANSGSISAEIGGDADLVHEFDLAGGNLELSAMQYVPTGGTGTSYFILLNTYSDGGDDKDWSVQLACNLETGIITSDQGGGATANILYDQWIELKFDIDLDGNTINEYYNGTLLSTHVWDDDAHGTLQCIDLFANGASPIYYDDIMLDSLTDLSGDDKTNFKDFAELAVWWLDEQLWP